MSFFKAYDMRGTFGTDFDLALVERIGAALPRVVRGKRWLIGRDCRLSSEAMRASLVKGLLSAGVEVTDLGLSTTSMLYFFTGEDAYDGSVMITASHNPPADNGLKVSQKTALPVSYQSGLKDVEALVTKAAELPCADSPGKLIEDTSCAARYLAWMKAKLPVGLERLRFAIDCSNGMSSLFVKDLFPQAVIINDVRDGNFPAHSPNPLKKESRQELARVVREMKLDCGVIFDGDADRAMFVDERGAFVQPDYLIPIIARTTPPLPPPPPPPPTPPTPAPPPPHLSTFSRPPILHDIRTSRGTIETLREWGFEPVMVPVGPALAKPMMRQTGAPAGGELAGHYYFAEFHGCDSGLLAAIRVLGAILEAKAAGMTFSQLMAPIMTRYANSGELNYKVEDKDAAIVRALKAAETFGPELGRSEIDGIRVEYAEGWFNIRKSNTEPYLRLLVECRTPEQLATWVTRLEAAIQS